MPPPLRDGYGHQASPAQSGEGSCERHRRDRLGKALQVGRNPADPSGRRAQGDRTRHVRRRLQAARHAVRQDPALAARPRAHPLDRHLGRREAAGREGGDDGEGPAGPEVRLHRPRARRGEFLARHPQHHGAREGAVRGPRHRRRRCHQRVDRRRGRGADQGRLRGAAARHRRGRGDEARRAAAVRGHDHARRRAGADQALQHLEAAGVQGRRSRCRLRAGRRGDREGIQDRRGAPGLYRAARLPGALGRRRPDRDLVVEPGPLPDARADRADPARSRSATSASIRRRSAAASAARR